MVHVGFYVHGHKAYLPVSAKTEAGFYLNVEPVEIIDISDSEAFESALKRVLSRGNPPVMTPARDKYPRPVVLKHANATTWSSFEKAAEFWSLDQADDWRFGRWNRHSEGGWEPDPHSEVHIADQDDAIQQLVASVQATH